jgi:hypothetical protein
MFEPTILVCGSRSECQIEDGQSACYHTTLEPKWLNLCYDSELPDSMIRHGYWGAGCGGSFDWFLTNGNPDDEGLETVPYQNQKKLYVFHFYRQIGYLTSPMGLVLKEYLEQGQLYLVRNHQSNILITTVVDLPTDNPICEDQDHGLWFIFLSNDSISSYNETEMCLQEWFDGNVDAEDLGGELHFSNLF